MRGLFINVSAVAQCELPQIFDVTRLAESQKLNWGEQAKSH